MDSLPPTTLPLALEALLERAHKELRRLDGGPAVGTEAVGGWAKLGSRLDDVLRLAFERQCVVTGRVAESEFRRLSGQSAWSLAIASAGQLVAPITRAVREAPTRDALVDAVSRAADDSRSALRRAIACRNAVVHERSPRPAAELRATLVELVAWVDGL